MSKFIDKLNRASTTNTQSMGFRTAQPISKKPKILIIASLNQANIDNAANCVTGADAGLLHLSDLSSAANAIKEISQTIPDIPWGILPEKIDREIVTSNCDFVAFSAVSTPLVVLQDNKLGKILILEESLNDNLVRTANELSVDAVLIDSKYEEKSFLTWHHLMLFQRFAGMLTKPLLATVPPDITANELYILWEAGIDGALINIEARKSTNSLKDLSQAISNLAFPLQRKQGKAVPLLPHMNTILNSTDEDDELE
ncbi:MAG: hypothetical protein PHQ86_04380 [Dehalococcoidales bacterium]|nr:hypothetical protein [Dehalococcoidales bacterium]